MKQLTFHYEYDDDKTLKTYIVGSNGNLVNRLLTTQHEFMQSYIYAPKNCGKTHLLFAIADQLSKEQMGMYISLEEAKSFGVEIFEELEHSDFVLIDDLDQILDDRDWEIALYSLINKAREVNRCHLVFTATDLPKYLNFSLNDLRTRLQWAESFYLNPLTNDELKLLIISMVKSQGLEINDQVIEFIYRHYDWNLPSITTMSEKLCAYAIEHNTRITIPLVKKALM